VSSLLWFLQLPGAFEFGEITLPNAPVIHFKAGTYREEGKQITQ